MIEGVARAIFAELGWEGVGAHPAFEHDQELWSKAARAAIEAMREPTSKMLAAAVEAGGICDPPEWVRADWQIMIDEALKA